MIVEQKRVVEIPTTGYILKFDDIRDYCKVKKYIAKQSCYAMFDEDFDVIFNDPSNQEITIDLANTFIDTFVSILREMPDMNARFIMTQDLNCNPDYTFGPEVSA